VPGQFQIEEAPRIRMSQNARLAETIAISSPKSGRPIDRKPIDLPSQAQEKSQIETGTIKRAIRHPAGLARHDALHEPRMNQANAVVIPQVGQGRPVTKANVQGPRPSCV
jgi:hypothetical protein